MAQLETRVFRVVDLHCEACEERIRVALSMLPGIKGVKSDRRLCRVEVRLDEGKTRPEEVAERLEYLGFPLAATAEGQESAQAAD